LSSGIRLSMVGGAPARCLLCAWVTSHTRRTHE
jgi:hypothetical protein